MEHTMTRKPSRFQLNTWLAIPLGGTALFVLGGLFSLLTSTHHYGIAAFLIMIPHIFLITYTGIMIGRWGRVKDKTTGALLAVTFSIAYIAGELTLATMIEHHSLGGLFTSRWTDGYELFGSGSFALKGWLWALAYALRVLLVISVFLIALLTEGERQFCELCNSSTTKTQCKAVIKSFDPFDIEHLSSLKEMLTLKPTPNAPQGLWIRIRTCKCKRLGEIKVETYKIEEDVKGTTRIDSIPLSQRMFTQVCEWANAFDPAAANDLSAISLDEASATGPAFDPTVKPDGEHWESVFRWEGAGTAMEWRCDTLYTRRLREVLKYGHYEVIDQALAHAQNINDTACIYEAAADWPKPQDWIDLWCQDHPESTAAHTVAGINLVKQAWIKRGSGYTPKNVDQFLELLDAAMVELNIATELEASNAVAWAWKIYAGKGLQHEHELVRSYFDAALQIAPDLHAAHWMHFDYLTPKWFGSETQCVAFAKEVLNSRSKGSPAFAAVAYTYFELAWENRKKPKKTGFKDYINRPDIRSDIIKANQLAFTDHQESMVTPRVRAFFAYMLWQLGEYTEARKHMEVLGKSTPWDPFTPSVFFLSKDTYAKARKACGL